MDNFCWWGHIATREKTTTKPEARWKTWPGSLTNKQRAFVDFVLAQYVDQGVDELDQEKLSPLLRLLYRVLNDAFAELGKPDDVRRLFVGVQKHFYAQAQQ